jgi:hypothetical protein
VDAEAVKRRGVAFGSVGQALQGVLPRRGQRGGLAQPQRLAADRRAQPRGAVGFVLAERSAQVADEELQAGRR